VVPVAGREGQLTRTFVTLTDSLVDDFDIAELLQQLVEECVSLLEVSAAALVLADPAGRLQVMAASSEPTRLLEADLLAAGEGPALECFRTGTVVVVPDVAAAAARWPVLTAQAARSGVRSVSALPMRLHARTIGALDLHRTRAGEPGTEDLQIAQALADVATIAILQHRAAVRSELLSGQLQNALNSRTVIEQAKGVLAERAGLDMAEAFARLRGYARRTQRPLAEVAREVVAGGLDV